MVRIHSIIHIMLQLLHAAVPLFAERHLVKLFQYRPVKPLK
jgi:hypothetical protein